MPSLVEGRPDGAHDELRGVFGVRPRVGRLRGDGEAMREDERGWRRVVHPECLPVRSRRRELALEQRRDAPHEVAILVQRELGEARERRLARVRCDARRRRMARDETHLWGVEAPW